MSAKISPKLAAYLSAGRNPLTDKDPEIKASEAPAPHGQEPKNPACGCSYCTGNALVVPQSHKPLRGKRNATAPAAVFAEAPGSMVEIQIAYTVQGFRSRPLVDAPERHGPQIIPEQIVCAGWTMPAPSDVQ